MRRACRRLACRRRVEFAPTSPSLWRRQGAGQPVAAAWPGGGRSCLGWQRPEIAAAWPGRGRVMLRVTSPPPPVRREAAAAAGLCHRRRPHCRAARRSPLLASPLTSPLATRRSPLASRLLARPPPSPPRALGGPGPAVAPQNAQVVVASSAMDPAAAVPRHRPPVTVIAPGLALPPGVPAPCPPPPPPPRPLPRLPPPLAARRHPPPPGRPPSLIRLALPAPGLTWEPTGLDRCGMWTRLDVARQLGLAPAISPRMRRCLLPVSAGRGAAPVVDSWLARRRIS